MIDILLSEAKTKMEKSASSVQGEFTKVRTGRAHPSLIDQLQVPYYGADVPLSQVANIAVEDARTLSITPWEKDMIQPIEKAIMTSDLGLNPVTAGSVIRVPLPPLTEERRKEMVRLVKSCAEGGRVAIRNIRRDFIAQAKDLLKSKDITEDELRKAEDDIQKLTDAAIVEVEKTLTTKEKDILEV